MDKAEQSTNARQQKQDRPHTTPPPIDASLQMKWGLALLGEEKGKQYIAWLVEKVKRQSQ